MIETTTKIALRGECTGGDGPGLSAYPLLVYVPGYGVLTANRGLPIGPVAEDAAIDGPEDAAAFHGCTVDEAIQAHAYMSKI
jgi:hypothetical protein